MIVQYGLDGLLLVGCFLKRKSRGEAIIQGAFGVQCEAGLRQALGLYLEQFSGHIMDFFSRLALGFFPGFAAQAMQRCMLGAGARITRYQMQLRHRYIQFVALGVFNAEEFADAAAGFQADQALIAADTMVFMHNRRADADFIQVAQDRFRILVLRLCGAGFG